MEDSMGFDTIIGNGAVVTATDTYVADVAIHAGKIVAIGKDLPRENAKKVLDASEKYVLPGGIDVHTHLDMPFGGTTSADDFETGTRAAAFGGTTTLIDFAIQYKGQALRQAFDAWMNKASSKAVCDYAFHCIVTDIGGGQLQEMTDLVGEGVTSFKLFMAYPGVFMLDDASIFRALQKTAKNGGLICMHAENGSASGRQDGAEVSRADAAHDCRGGGGVACHRAGGDGGRSYLYRAFELP
jgi:dihydropyrimidinase